MCSQLIGILWITLRKISEVFSVCLKKTDYLEAYSIYEESYVFETIYKY